MAKGVVTLREDAFVKKLRCVTSRFKPTRVRAHCAVNFTATKYRFSRDASLAVSAAACANSHCVEVNGAEFRKALSSLEVGQTIVLYATSALTKDRQTRHILAVIGFVPWFLAPHVVLRDIENSAAVLLEWRSFYSNELVSSQMQLGEENTSALAMLEVAASFMVPPESDAAEPTEWPPKTAALFSFCLRWHKATHARPISGGYDEFESYRDTLRRDVLYRRSCVFFSEPPRIALFGGADAWPTVIGALRRLRSSRAAEFVARQLGDVVTHIVRLEVLPAGDLAVFYHLQQLLVPLAAQIERADAADARRALGAALPPELCTPESQPLRNLFLTQQSRKARAIERWPLGLRVRMLKSIGADEITADQRRQLAEELDADAPAAPLLAASSEGSRSLRRSHILLEESTGGGAGGTLAASGAVSFGARSSNGVVVSFEFGAGCKTVVEALLALNNRRRCVVSRGRVYLRGAQALVATQRLFDTLLKGHVYGVDVADLEMEPLERQLCESMPVVDDRYRDMSRRMHDLDDMAIGTDVFREFYVKWPAAEKRKLGDYLNGKRNGVDRFPIPPPERYDDAFHYRLVVDDEWLNRHERIPNTLFSRRVGSIVVPPDELDLPLHTPECGHARGYRMSEDEAGRRLHQAMARCSASDGVAVADMEDLVGNAIENRAIPPCLVAMMRKPPLPNSAMPHDYLRWGERGWVARALHSFQAPSLTTTQIVRSMLRYSTPSMCQEHYSIIAKSDEAEMTRCRSRSVSLKRSRSAVGDAARIEATTTCGFACSSLAKPGVGQYCVFAPERAADLDRILVQTGIADPRDRERLRNAAASPTDRCLLHLQLSRLPGAIEVPVLDAGVAGVRISQPFDYYHLAARHLAKFFRSMEPPPPPQTTEVQPN